MRAEYEARRRDREERAGRLRGRERRLSHLRLALVAVALAAGWLGFVSKAISPAWTALPLLAFSFVVVRHHLVVEARIRAQRAAAYYAAGIRRLDGEWTGHGPQGKRFDDLHHLYASDLDLFGEGSLFQLLCRARTRTGERALAGWLKRPADSGTILARQAAVADLKGRLDFREELAVIGEALQENLEPDPLRAWAEGESHPADARTRTIARLLPVATLASLFAWPIGPIVLLLVQTLFAWSRRRGVQRSVTEAERAGADLDLLVDFFHRVGTEHLEAPLLREMLEGRGSPERELARLKGIIDRIDARANPYFAPIGALLLWTTRHAFAVEAWRAEHGARLLRWLDLAGEFEALASLATHAHETGDPFPKLGEGFDAAGLGHPLLPRDACVRNDVALTAQAPLLLVSGSNMSGKSTLLRAVGTAAVMAYAGGTVCARSLALGRFQIGASIVSRDSIREGTSRFYAEITRLRAIVEAARGGPVLYLLDELLMGTNSHDRRTGAEALMRGLVATGALGLVTTHDLALTEVAGARNVHFADQMEDGAMRFDHVLREGVVTRSNAIALMRAVGLDV